MKKSSMELKFTEDELLIQQLLHSNNLVNTNTIEIKMARKLKKKSFWFRNNGAFHSVILFDVFN